MTRSRGWPMVLPEGATHIGTARIRTDTQIASSSIYPKHEIAKCPPPKQSKYRNVKVNVDGTKFDSKKEAGRYHLLKLQEEAGEIGELTLQQRFLLTPRLQRDDGRWEEKSEYVADFTYVRDGVFVVEDVKSKITRKDKAYILKRKQMLSLHGISIKEID